MRGLIFMVVVQGVENTSLVEFANGEAGMGIDVRDGATKLLAGDYCCYSERPPIISPQARLEAALQALDTKVGAVMLQSDLENSLKVETSVFGL